MLHTRTLQITILAILAILTLILDASTRIYAQLQRKPITALYPQHQDLCVVDTYIALWFKYGKPLPSERYSKAIYFDRKKVQYYSVTNIQETNNIFFSFNPKKQEKVFAAKEREFVHSNNNRLLYVGNVSQLERVYVDTNDNKQYIKTLIPKKLDRYYARDPKDYWNKTLLKPMNFKIYPALHPCTQYKWNDVKNIYELRTNKASGMDLTYTNKTGQRFNLSWSVDNIPEERPRKRTPEEYAEYAKQLERQRDEAIAEAYEGL